MDVKAFPALIVGVVVALVLAGATLPIWADTLADSDTLNNDTGVQYGYLKKIDNTTTYTLSWDVTDKDNVIVDGETIPLYTGSIICGGDPDFIIRYWSGSTSYIQGRDGTTNFTANSTITIAILSGVITITADNNDPVTYALTEGYAIAKEGAYIMKNPTQAVYMTGDTEFIGYGVTSLPGNSTLWLKVSGTISDGVTEEIISGPAGTFGDSTFNKTDVSTYKDTYNLTSLAFDYTNTSTGTTTEITYSYFIVPAEITAERAVFMDGPLGVLVGVLPLLIVAGLVTGAVVWFINRKG